VSVNKHNHEPTKTVQRKFSKRNVEKIKDMLNNETWEEIYLTKNPNELYCLFVNRFLFYFMRAFPKKVVKKSKVQTSSWITKEIQISCQKM
jgi:hypothetical protein